MQALDKVLEILRTSELYSPYFSQPMREEDAMTSDLVGGLVSVSIAFIQLYQYLIIFQGMSIAVQSINVAILDSFLVCWNINVLRTTVIVSASLSSSVLPVDKTLTLSFYAPRSNDRGHTVFVLSVCLSVVNFNLRYNFWTEIETSYLACILY